MYISSSSADNFNFINGMKSMPFNIKKVRTKAHALATTTDSS